MSDTTKIQPTTTGYADVNGLHLYYETYGSGAPLVVLHGGMLTIDISFGRTIRTLARTHTVIAAEMQGHGRTADTDREITYPGLAQDVVALLDHLGVERAAVMGHSLGGGIALELAVNHPDRVSAIIPMSASVNKDGLHPDLSDPSTYQTSPIMPTPEDFAEFRGAYDRLSPHPEHFDDFLVKMGGIDAAFPGWTDEQLAGIDCPVLIVQGDHDFTLASHGAAMLDKIPGSALAVLPATTHMQVTRRASILLPILDQFFADHPGV